MSITRSKNKLAYGFNLDRGVPWAYASLGGSISTFVADDSNLMNHVGSTYRVHKFSSVGASSIFFDTAGLIDVFVIAGGGSGGGCGQSNQGSGGGAGGVIIKYEQYVKPGTSLVYVGSGGNGTTGTTNGEDSYFNQYLALGGGGGAVNWGNVGNAGGSGGGSGQPNFLQSGLIDQGNFGAGSASNGVGGGGGGAGISAPNVFNTSIVPPDGGDGIQVAFENNTPTYYAGGGVGGVRGVYTSPLPTGGLGGGGSLGGTPGGSWNGGDATFYGSGGGGAARTATSGTNIGGSGYQGIVIIRYVVGES